MTQAWQLVIVGICVAAAAAWVGREVWRMLRSGKSSGCGSCGSCATSSSPANAQNFVPLEKLERDAGKP